MAKTLDDFGWPDRAMRAGYVHASLSPVPPVGTADHPSTRHSADCQGRGSTQTSMRVDRVLSSLTLMMTCPPTALPSAGPRLWTALADLEDLMRGHDVIKFPAFRVSDPSGVTARTRTTQGASITGRLAMLVGSRQAQRSSAGRIHDRKDLAGCEGLDRRHHQQSSRKAQCIR